MKFSLFFALLFLIAFPVSAEMDLYFNNPTIVSSYSVSLVYDGKTDTIFPVSGTTTVYRIVRKDFTPATSSFGGDFLGILIGAKEKTLQRFGIPKPENIITGKRMPYTVPAPYAPGGERIDVYKGSVRLFSIDVSASRICREDGMCSVDAGENDRNCGVDCVFAPPPREENVRPTEEAPLPITPGALPPETAIGDLAEEEEGGFSPVLLALGFFSLGLASFGVWMYLRKRNEAA